MRPKWGGVVQKYCIVGSSGVKWRPCSGRSWWGSTIHPRCEESHRRPRTPALRVRRRHLRGQRARALPRRLRPRRVRRPPRGGRDGLRSGSSRRAATSSASRRRTPCTHGARRAGPRDGARPSMLEYAGITREVDASSGSQDHLEIWDRAAWASTWLTWRRRPMLPQMSLQLREYEMALAHTPVLLDELLELLRPAPGRGGRRLHVRRRRPRRGGRRAARRRRAA